MKTRSKTHLAVLAASALLLVGCFGQSADQFLAEAKTKIDAKESEAAVIQLKNALQKDPNLAEARFLLGKVMLESGDMRGAAIELGKAKDLGYSDDLVVPLMAQAMVGQGQLQEVLTSFDDIQLQSPEAISNLKASLAVAYGGLGRSVQAEEAIQSAVSVDPSNTRAQLVRIRLLAGGGSIDDALLALDALMAKSPSSEAWQLKGDLLARTNKRQEAMQAYREAVILNKGNVPAQIGLMQLLLAKRDLEGATAQLAALKTARAGQGQVLMFTALLALERNDLKLARDSAQTLLKNAPEDPRVLNLAGAIEYRRGALLEAENYLSRALQSTPTLTKARLLLAQTKLRQGDAAKALNVLQPLLDEQGGSVEAYTIAAEAYLQSGEPQRAEEYFTKASELNPKDVRSRVALALAQVSKGHLSEGVSALRALAASDSGVTADMGLITTFLQRRDWDQALKAIDGLEIKTPDRPTAANLRGRVELARGNKDRAGQAFEAAVKIDPVFFPAIASLAALDADAGRTDAAKARFQHLLETQPNNVQANMAVIALSAKAGASKDELAASLDKLVKQMPTEAQPRLALIEMQQQRRDFKAAVASAQDAVAALPDNADAWRLLAQSQAVAGDANQAINSVNKWATLAPRSPEPQLMLAEIYAKQGDKPSQTQALKRSLAIKADFRPAQLALFASELGAGHYSEARRVAETAQTRQPADAMGTALLADVSAAQKDWTSAVTGYRAALKLQPVPEVAIKLHRALNVGGKPADAKAFESEWTAAHPQDAVFLDYLGSLALMQQNLPLAEQRYQAVLKIQPDNPIAANNIAWLLNKAKKPGALAFSEKANKVAPDQPAFMDTLAQIYADNGQMDKALEIQKRAVGLAPDLAAHRLHLARYYVAAGQKAEARTELSRLSALGDKFGQQAEVSKLLATL
ncbi:PEP-CTERM system TPR-repeat protein PrsT [Paucibacter sp. R3-3]|uniref:PEP-CTERM system TPR-repeat protein PrsT n=1 Tax=Roseateles agri TaxID=3098619 RepID=A0ABU5DLQ0_9BURK|nr:XrtA/PEP-CTERM system TPR-repeat protein PrsT [Paucibacter sp. R3-3]MDY0747223.1 PEP-CTERM system TPR-repeat protein PrsT [Paucibacter sp. R3-3]